MYSWENIRPGAWLLVVIQSKLHDGKESDSVQPGPYIPFLKVLSGTFSQTQFMSWSSGVVFLTQKKGFDEDVGGVYVQPFNQEIDDLM